MNKTSIEWTHRPETGGAAGGFTWNPIRARRIDGLPESALADGSRTGTFCTHISPGCVNCYAEAIGKRFGTGLAFNVPNLAKIEFFIDEKILEEPLRRKKPATIFAGDMFDLFHEAIPDDYILRVFSVISAGTHTFQVLTKRAVHMHNFMHKYERYIGVLENCWLGVSVESQQYADERIPLLLQTPAAVRFLSVEPMLGPVKLDTWLYDGYYELKHAPGIDWVICGGESGHGARPMHPDWARAIRDECVAAHRAFFFKQWGSGGRPSSRVFAGSTQATEFSCCPMASGDARAIGGTAKRWQWSASEKTKRAQFLMGESGASSPPKGL